MEQPIYLETTQVDDDLLAGFRIEEKVYAGRHILYMARVEADKGIFETLDALAALEREGAELVVAGSGPALADARAHAEKAGMTNVEFIGYAFGADKVAALSAADIYIFPTHYGEGMPNSVLEAMAFGLPVITRPVGGLRDFFEDGRMGFLTESRDAGEYARLIDRLLGDPAMMGEIGHYNYRYAEQRFWAGRVARRLQGIYEATLAGRRNANTGREA